MLINASANIIWLKWDKLKKKKYLHIQKLGRNPPQRWEEGEGGRVYYTKLDLPIIYFCPFMIFIFFFQLSVFHRYIFLKISKSSLLIDFVILVKSLKVCELRSNIWFNIINILWKQNLMSYWISKERKNILKAKMNRYNDNKTKTILLKINKEKISIMIFTVVSIWCIYLYLGCDCKAGRRFNRHVEFWNSSKMAASAVWSGTQIKICIDW